MYYFWSIDRWWHPWPCHIWLSVCPALKDFSSPTNGSWDPGLFTCVSKGRHHSSFQSGIINLLPCLYPSWEHSVGLLGICRWIKTSTASSLNVISLWKSTHRCKDSAPQEPTHESWGHHSSTPQTGLQGTVYMCVLQAPVSSLWKQNSVKFLSQDRKHISIQLMNEPLLDDDI